MEEEKGRKEEEYFVNHKIVRKNQNYLVGGIELGSIGWEAVNSCYWAKNFLVINPLFSTIYT